MSSSLEVEVKAQHQAVAGQVGTVRRQPFAPDPRILVVPGKSCAAVHDRVEAVTEHVVIKVAEVRGGCRVSLLRHPDPFRSLEEDQLRIMHPVGLYECAIPCGTAEAGNGCSRNVIRGAGIVNRIPKARSKPWAVGPMLGHNLKIQFVEIEQPNKTFAAESLVSDPR